MVREQRLNILKRVVLITIGVTLLLGIILAPINWSAIGAGITLFFDNVGHFLTHMPLVLRMLVFVIGVPLGGFIGVTGLLALCDLVQPYFEDKLMDAVIFVICEPLGIAMIIGSLMLLH